MSKEERFFGTSVIENMLTGGTKEEASPPGSESALSQGLQAMINMTIDGTKKLMSKALRQQGISPMSILKNLIFRQSITGKTQVIPKNQSAFNKVIKAVRQKYCGKTI